MVQTVINKSPKVKGKANIAFIIDVTGSMTPCLENLKNNLINLTMKIDEICKKDYGIEDLEINYNAMGFRDIEEDEDWQIVMRDKGFTENIDDIKNFFSKEEMKAAGGGSIPESALDAIYRSIKEMVWDKPAKVLVLFTDAPTKPSLDPSTTAGKKLNPSQSLSVVKEIIASNSIRVIIFGPKDVPEFEVIGSLDNCTYIGDDKIEDTLKNFKDESLFKENIIKLIAKTASASVKDTLAL